MKSRTIMVLSAIGLALGLGAASGVATAQNGNSDCGCVDTTVIAREITREQVAQAMRAAQVEVRAAALQARANAVSAAVTERVQARVNAALQQAVTPRVIVNGQDSMSIEETGWLGVTPSDVSEDKAKELKLSPVRGVYLDEVEKDSPAEKAGLKSGDVIIEFNGQRVEGVVQFRRMVRETPPGHTVALTVWRDGRSQTFDATLVTVNDQFNRQFDLNLNSPSFAFTVPSPAPRLAVPAPATPLNPPEVYSFTQPGGREDGYFYFGNTPTIGVNTQNLSGQLGSYFGAPDGEGVLVQSVVSDSPAENAGVKAGDVIIKLDGNRVRTQGDLQSELREKRDDKTVQLTILRKGSEMTITVEPNKPRSATMRSHPTTP
jgi:serine protease Do